MGELTRQQAEEHIQAVPGWESSVVDFHDDWSSEAVMVYSLGIRTRDPDIAISWHGPAENLRLAVAAVRASQPPTEAEVEAMAIRLRGAFCRSLQPGDFDGISDERIWDVLSDGERRLYRDVARAALGAGE